MVFIRWVMAEGSHSSLVGSVEEAAMVTLTWLKEMGRGDRK